VNILFRLKQVFRVILKKQTDVEKLTQCVICSNQTDLFHADLFSLIFQNQKLKIARNKSSTISDSNRFSIRLKAFENDEGK
jgi:hypothetical protein